MARAVSFGTRLEQLANQARWTAYDFAHWFGYPRATVRNWFMRKFEPRSYKQQEALAALDLLEKCITKGWLAELRGVSAHERPNVIRRLRSRADRNLVPRPRLANSRVASRLHRSR